VKAVKDGLCFCLMAPRAKPMPLPSQVDALRALAKKVEATGKGLPPELAEAVAEALEDLEDAQAVHEARERLAKGGKTIPFADVRRKLGI
jgi:predicted DNA-binding protein